MDVDVHRPREHQETGRVDLLGAGAQTRADVGDDPVGHRDVVPVAADDEVVHP